MEAEYPLCPENLFNPKVVNEKEVFKRDWEQYMEWFGRELDRRE